MEGIGLIQLKQQDLLRRRTLASRELLGKRAALRQPRHGRQGPLVAADAYC